METHNPRLKVEFILNEQGEPTYIEKNGLKHFRIRISTLEFADDIYEVQYQLDPTYINPFRVEDNRQEKFSFTTTTYGDYSVSASLMGKKGNHVVSCIISKALRESHPDHHAEIERAISDIKSA